MRNLLTALVFALITAGATQAAGPTQIEVWKNPSCGCCEKWIDHLRQAGFEVIAHNTNRVNEVRASLSMPSRYASCHSARIGEYAIEGHVPAADIQRLLKEKPTALGLSVPGMPIGSPGMDGPGYENRRDRYDVLLVQKHGTSAVFNSYS